MNSGQELLAGRGPHPDRSAACGSGRVGQVSRPSTEIAPLSRRSLLALGVSVVIGACSGAPNRASVPATSAPSDAAPTGTGATGSSTSNTTEPFDTAPVTTEPATTEYAPLPDPPLDGAVEYTGKRTPFTLGVASGDPTPYRVVLWTRLAPRPLAPDGGMDSQSYRVHWEVALDEDFAEIVFTGVSRADPEHAHSVHVDLAELEPAVEFYYRFRSGTHVSTVGRTQTMPLLTLPESITIGTTTGQRYETGYFVAHRDAARSRLDLMVFLGDYLDRPVGDASASGGKVIRSRRVPPPQDLAGFRLEYARQKTDPDLQASHASCPWLIGWSDRGTNDAAAYQAWWEHMPVRLPPPAPGGEYRTYRTSQFGSLAAFTLLDTRQYRLGATMLGAAQEEWFALTHGNQNTVWSAVLSEVMLATTVADGVAQGLDHWDGYPTARDRLLRSVVASKAENTVVLSGEPYVAAVATIHRSGAPTASAGVATEFATPSVSSSGLAPTARAVRDAIASDTAPDILAAEVDHRGWVRHTVTPQSWTAEYRIVERPERKNSRVTTWKSFTVRDGTVGARAVESAPG